jgi:REP element-mobilizing transposase RayT
MFCAPLAYLITFHGYGTRLHGAAEGSVHHSRAVYGTDPLPEMPLLAEFEQEHLGGPPFIMSYADAHVALAGVKAACARRRWDLIACHARTTHVHSVVHGEIEPEAIMDAMKAYATRRLNKTHPEDLARRRWSRHGSTKYLWEPEDVEAAIEYVLHEQGEPIAVFQKDRDRK